MFQTLVLVPGQAGIFLEHDSRKEAQSVLHNVKTAGACHNGAEVTAIPLNYDPESHRSFYLDVGDLPQAQVAEFVEDLRQYIAARLPAKKEQA